MTARVTWEIAKLLSRLPGDLLGRPKASWKIVKMSYLEDCQSSYLEDCQKNYLTIRDVTEKIVRVT